MTSRTLLFAVALVFFLTGRESMAQLASNVTPPIKWKYGWRDGNRANTIGGARARNVLPFASEVPSTGYLPSQISKAYGFDQITGTNSTGTGQRIAIIVAYGSPNLQSDLDTFNAQYGLPSNSVPVYYPSGTPTNNDSGWAAETTLDVEWAHAMAPGASIAVVVAPNPSLSSLLNAVNYATGTLKANVVSMSWGAAEFSGSTTYDSYFNKSGISFVAATGDSGAAVNWPAVSTNVLAVGGTSLLYDTAAGSVSSETAWSGSSGGVSKFVGLPSYQSGWNTVGVTNTTSTATNNLSFRGVPDVSYVADPYTGVSVYFTDPSTKVGGWYVFGGTSAGAPQWAALLARRAAMGKAGTAKFNPVVYAASKLNYPTLFRDITSGANGFPAKTGYDVVTGLGSPFANNIANLSSSNSTTSPSPTPSPTPKRFKGGAKTATVYGFGAFGETNVPSALDDVKQISVGMHAVLALKETGTIVPWGWNVYGQLRIPAGLTNVSQIATGIYHAAALRSDGTVAAWGMNILRQTNVPAGLTNVTQIAVGGYNTVALRGDGRVVVWGNNAQRQCNVPASLTNVVQVAAGFNHVIALTGDGKVTEWGNVFRQTNVTSGRTNALSGGTNTPSSTTNLPSSLTNVVQVDAGYLYSAALRRDGTVAVWGWNAYGVTNVPAGLSNVVKISAGPYHMAALKSDGTVKCWGANFHRQCNIPTNATNVTDVSAGFHNTAIIQTEP